MKKWQCRVRFGTANAILWDAHVYHSHIWSHIRDGMRQVRLETKLTR